jgi:hypothetical protein
MFDNARKQFYLAWKPNENREGNPYLVPDDAGMGQYAGTVAAPATLDYYTDEALIVILLAAGSTTHPIDARSAYCSLLHAPDSNGLIRTYPGALFTYQFLRAFLDTENLDLAACPGEASINWYANSRKAINAVISAVSANPLGLSTYGPNAWGISAAEGPDDIYRAYGVPGVAIDANAPQDGTVTYYAMVSSISFGNDLTATVVSALNDARTRGLLHYRFGLPDAVNSDISSTALQPALGNALLRSSGPWVERQLFAIDEGPMVLHLENQSSGLIWNLLANNANIARALGVLQAPSQIVLEAENGTGDGGVMLRGAASGAETVLLHDGQSRTFSVQVSSVVDYAISVCYSNDNRNDMAGETLDVTVDGSSVGQFVAQDTGDGGLGWNVFACNSAGTAHLVPGAHTLAIHVSGGDGYGVELDVVKWIAP